MLSTTALSVCNSSAAGLIRVIWAQRDELKTHGSDCLPTQYEQAGKVKLGKSTMNRHLHVKRSTQWSYLLSTLSMTCAEVRFGRFTTC